MTDTKHAGAGVIPYATPEPRRTDGPFARGHATLAYVTFGVLSLNVAAFAAALTTGVDEFAGAAVLLNLAAAHLTPVVVLLRRPGSIHWVAGTLFYFVTIFGVAVVAVLIAGMLTSPFR